MSSESSSVGFSSSNRLREAYVPLRMPPPPPRGYPFPQHHVTPSRGRALPRERRRNDVSPGATL